MRKALVTAALIVGTGVVLWGSLHIFVRPVNPQQKTPDGHFGGACWACHFVSDSAKLVDE